MIGADPVVVCIPAEEKIVDPADSDMKQPTKYVLPKLPPAFAYGFAAVMPAAPGSCSPTVNPAYVTDPSPDLLFPLPAPKTLR
jgi:hypothetical protein